MRICLHNETPRQLVEAKGAVGCKVKSSQLKSAAKAPGFQCVRAPRTQSFLCTH